MSSRSARLGAFLWLGVVVSTIKIQRMGLEILDQGLKELPPLILSVIRAGDRAEPIQLHIEDHLE